MGCSETTNSPLVLIHSLLIDRESTSVTEVTERFKIVLTVFSKLKKFEGLWEKTGTVRDKSIMNINCYDSQANCWDEDKENVEDEDEEGDEEEEIEVDDDHHLHMKCTILAPPPPSFWSQPLQTISDHFGFK